MGKPKYHIIVDDCWMEKIIGTIPNDVWEEAEKAVAADNNLPSWGEILYRAIGILSHTYYNFYDEKYFNGP